MPRARVPSTVCSVLGLNLSSYSHFSLWSPNRRSQADQTPALQWSQDVPFAGCRNTVAGMGFYTEQRPQASLGHC